MKLVFATNNKHKLEEIRQAVDSNFIIHSLAEMNIIEEIPETSNTLEGNAIQKARYIFKKYNINCFADDTGLEVEALNNQPGVFSARYAGEHCSFEDNVNKLLREMQGMTNRKALFRTVIAFIHNDEIRTFEGKIKGTITTGTRGIKGFGYDPVFLPDNYQQTFAEMPLSLKNMISHRGLALQKFTDFLNANVSKMY